MKETNELKCIKIGTRQSALALVQTALVSESLKSKFPETEIEIVKKQTAGDKNLKTALADFGGKGAFVTEFEDALSNREIDLAVHSAKDLPAQLPDGLTIAMTLPREDPRDVLVWRNEETKKVAETSSEAFVVGTSSPRRELQIKAMFPNCACKILRGNVPTRLLKLSNGEYDAIILAAAGLKRLGLWDENKNEDSSDSTEKKPFFQPLEFEQMLPAGGQGIIAVECRKITDPAKPTDKALNKLLSVCNDKTAFAEFKTERYLIFKLGCGCHEPTAVFSKISGSKMTITLLEERDGKPVRKSITGEIGEQFEEKRLFALADELLEKTYE
ncbi:hydroxymethylbilane synthase [Treponema zioleckii]|uniref:hydroxymethylbilane synthase n=1 Tax=Treponema zioleckii TaxID=331680 RepID=UPI00168AB990|nr:hydroxymethylbilane synthase [Treponema zioleckii]